MKLKKYFRIIILLMLCCSCLYFGYKEFSKYESNILIECSNNISIDLDEVSIDLDECNSYKDNFVLLNDKGHYIKTKYNPKNYNPHKIEITISNNTNREFDYLICDFISEEIIINGKYEECPYAVIGPKSSVTVYTYIWIKEDLTDNEKKRLLDEAKIEILFSGNFSRFKNALNTKSFKKIIEINQ